MSGFGALEWHSSRGDIVIEEALRVGQIQYYFWMNNDYRIFFH